MEFIGKLVLVGLSLINPDGSLQDRQQVVGRISEIRTERIILIKPDGKEFGLPPDIATLEQAQPGVYHLRKGNVHSVTNPDYIVQWNINLAPSEYASPKSDTPESELPKTFEAGYVPPQN